jgi:hypothetical protein
MSTTKKTESLGLPWETVNGYVPAATFSSWEYRCVSTCPVTALSA